jgi:C1A family cysteine protease
MERKFPVKKDKRDERDLTAKASIAVEELPEAVDLRPYMSEVVDQLNLGSCTANAIASGLQEYLQKKSGKRLTRLSRLFLYYFERHIEGTINEDAGAYIRDGMKVLQKIGCAPEKYLPYDVNRYREQPSADAYLNSGEFRITEYKRVSYLSTLKSILAEGYPVVMGMEVFDSFMTIGKDGIVPMPDPNKENSLGGHAVLICGYLQKNGELHYIVRNSWGKKWGDRGYCYIPESFFHKHVFDMWTGR